METDKSAGIDFSTGVFSCQKCGFRLSAAAFISRFRAIDISQAGVIVDAYRIENNIKVNVDNFAKRYLYTHEREDWRDLYILSRRIGLEETFAVDYAKERGFDLKVLDDAGVGWLPKAAVQQWNRDSLVFPYLYGGKLIGLRYRDEEGSKSGEEDSIMVPWGIDRVLPSTQEVIIVEGESDQLKLTYELQKRGLNRVVVSTPGSYFRSEWERDFIDLRRIVIIADSDTPGEQLVNNFQKHYGSVVIPLKLPWQRRQLGKDLCDWFGENVNDAQLKDDFIGRIEAELNSGEGTQTLQKTSDFLKSVDEQGDSALIKNFIWEGQTIVFAGQRKNKKTMLLLHFVKTLCNPGMDFIGIEDLVATEKLPKILFIQAEGSKQKFKERIEKIFGNGKSKNIDNIIWWYKPGLKLDNPRDVGILESKIHEVGASVVVLDTFVEFISGDEDKASGQAPFWTALSNISSRKNELVWAITMHFGKDKFIKDTWNSIRGSGRASGVVDAGLFIEDSKDGSALRFEFRDRGTLFAPDGKENWKVTFEESTLDMKVVVPSKSETAEKIRKLEEEDLRRNGDRLPREECPLQSELQSFFAVSAPTFNSYIERSTHLKKVGTNPQRIQWVENK